MDLSKESEEILKDLISMYNSKTLKGVFSDIPIEVYHRCPGVSSTQLKSVWARMNDLDYNDSEIESDALRFGQALHTYLLEPNLFNQFFVVGEKKAVAPGVSNITFSEFDHIKAITKSFMENDEARGILNGSMKEVSFFSVDEETGILKKCRADIFKNINGHITVSDVKTAQRVDSFSFAQASKKYFYRMSAAYYLEIISEIFGTRADTFNLIACQKSTPYKVKTYRVHYRSIQEGSLEIRYALQMLKRLETEGPSVWKEYDRGIKELLI